MVYRLSNVKKGAGPHSNLVWKLRTVFCFPLRPSTLVETPLQISLFFAKQTQFQNGQYKHKYSNHKSLCQRTTNNEQRTLFKTNPIKPNFKRRNSLLRLPDAGMAAAQVVSGGFF